jgi:hypothetical protein
MERDYREGGVWTFRDAPLLESRVVIGKIDAHERLGQVFSVSIKTVPLSTGAVGEIRVNDISHVPVTKSVLDASLLEQVGVGEPSEAFAEGYGQWRKAFDAGKAGVFTIEISKVVEAINEVWRKGTPVAR